MLGSLYLYMIMSLIMFDYRLAEVLSRSNASASWNRAGGGPCEPTGSQCQRRLVLSRGCIIYPA